ncbi:MAG TPA: hypothetical protein VM491_00690, partial [Burkholderiaceae bacterium]|nr:hypothetical protein [Burkholderiaceae bacterium]
MNDHPNPAAGERGFAFAGAAALMTILLLVSALSAAPAAAQTVVHETEPPGRVGRVSHLEGTVHYYADAQPDSGWVGAILNLPITSRTSLNAPPGSRAEAQIGSTRVRIDADSQADFVQVDDATLHVEAARGAVSARVRSLFDGEQFVIGARGATLQALAPGSYSIGVDPALGLVVAKVLHGS